MDSNQPDDTKPPPSIPDHQLLRRIGRGSYGEVWLARNMLGMYRAVKVVYRESFKTERPFDREWSGIQKFEPISRSHEGFVDVLQVGIKPGEYFYYVMELGDDQFNGQKIDPEHYAPKTLAKGIGVHGRLPFDECLKLGLALTQALAELHKHDLVHRDVKPSNIIFVNGVPKLADIGLVTNIAEARSYVGTEGFIPPEGPGAPTADIYSIGKVLYECSTGKDRHEFPELPTLLDEFPDYAKLLELNEIILQACKTDCGKRYQSAWHMHSDLLVLANGKSVKRLKLLERRLATLKRAASVSSITVIIAAFVLWQIYRERRAFVDARQRQIGADLADGNNAIATGDSLAALPRFAEVLRLDKNSGNEKEDRFRFASALAQCPALVQMWFSTNSILEAGFDPAGRRVLISQWGSQAQIFDMQTAKPASPPFGQPTGLRGSSFSPDGLTVVTASEDKTACVWRADDGVQILTLNHPDKVLSAAFSPDGKQIVTGCLDGVARIWSSASGKLERSVIGHTNAILCATFSHNGLMIATTSRDNTARVWNVKTGEQIGKSLAHSTWISCAAFSPDDRELATACFDHKARVWDLESQREILPELNHDSGVNSVQFSPDGEFLVTAGLDRMARLWSAADHQPAETNPILRHNDLVTSAAFAGDGHRIITASTDGTTRIWDLAGGTVASEPMRCAISDDGCRYATVTDGKIQVWDALLNRPISTTYNSSFPVQHLTLSPDGGFILAASVSRKPDDTRELVEIFETASGRLTGNPFFIPGVFTNLFLNLDGGRLLAVSATNAQTWNTLSGMPLSPLIAHEQNFPSAVFSPNGDNVATWAGNQTKVCDAVTGRELFPALEHDAPVKSVAFNRDGSRLVVCCSDNFFTKCSACVWESATGRAVGSPLRHEDGVLFAAFSPDGKRIATASEDYTAIVWDVNSGRQLSPALKHKDQVDSVAFSPDGKWIATASPDRTARVWSVATGEPLSPPLRHLSSLHDVKFLADGRHLLTGDMHGNSWIWNLPMNEQPSEDLRKISYLLTSGVIPPAGTSDGFGTNSLESVWQTLQTNDPSFFTVSTDQIAAWHQFAAEKYQDRKQWYAATFHWRQLLAINPTNSSALAGLNFAAGHLTENNPLPLVKSGR